MWRTFFEIATGWIANSFEVNIGLGNVLVSPGTKPLSDSLLTNIFGVPRG